MGTVVKDKMSELEEKVRAGILRRMRNYLSGVAKGVSGKKRFLVRFQDRFKKNLSSNQLTIVIVRISQRRKNLRFLKILRYLSRN